MSNYDEAVYDVTDVYDAEAVEVAALLSFAWGLEPLPEGDDMAAVLNYSLKLQQVGSNNIITNQADLQQSIALPQNVVGDQTYLIPGGAVDMPLNILTPNTDVVALFPTVEMTVKLNTVTGTPMTIRAGGVLFVDGKNITAVFVSNANAGPGNVRFIQAERTGS